MVDHKRIISVGLYVFCFLVALLLPWWLALSLLILPLPFIRWSWIGIVPGIIFDILYGISLPHFPFHTLRYTLIMAIAVLVASLLKKVLRL